ncbi:MAG TPA: hypothetical protein DCY79_16265 [Planctomycetaceae bacterium]|nr:hypothetical protein [Blastopirellula sp.]HAY81360.1 hypothetical protein [Planctomycetaceae bacterium]
MLLERLAWLTAIEKRMLRTIVRFLERRILSFAEGNFKETKSRMRRTESVAPWGRFGDRYFDI